MRIFEQFFFRQGKNLQAYFRMARIFNAVCNKICRKDVDSAYEHELLQPFFLAVYSFTVSVPSPISPSGFSYTTTMPFFV